MVARAYGGNPPAGPVAAMSSRPPVGERAGWGCSDYGGSPNGGREDIAASGPPPPSPAKSLFDNLSWSTAPSKRSGLFSRQD